MNPDDLPDFPLAPWELPPDSLEPLVAPATMRWHGTLFGRETDWLVRMVQSLNYWTVFVCAEDDRSKTTWYIGCAPLWKCPTHEEGLLSWLSNSFSNKPFDAQHRLIYVKDESDVKESLIWRLAVREKLASHADVFSSIANEWFPNFFVQWPFDFMGADSEQIHTKILQDWDDEDSDLSFTRRWLFSSLNAFSICWKRGDEAAFERIAFLTLLAFGPQCSPHELWWRFNIETGIWRCSELIGHALNQNLISPLVLELWGSALIEVFGPHWNEEQCCAHASVRDEKMADNHLRAWTKREDTSFHEQLEAARELSIWLDEREARGELPAATIARLCDTLR